QFVAAPWAVLNFPETTVRGKGEAVRRTVAAGPRLRWRQIRSREVVRADHGCSFRGFRVARRIDQRNSGRASLAGHRITRRGLAVERQPQDLAEFLIRVLRGCHALPIADGEE